MANGHGGKRPGAGRPRTPLSKKILEDNPGKRKLKTLEFSGEKYSEFPPKPDPPDYLEYYEAKRIGGPTIQELYNETIEWLQKTGCLHLIKPSIILMYTLLTNRYLECERIITYTNVVFQTPDTRALIPNAAAELGLKYARQADMCWDKIWSIVAQNCEHDIGGDNPNTKIMERLIRINFDND